MTGLIAWLLLSIIYICSQLGKTKVFLRAGQIGILDSRRSEALDSSAKCIQRKLRFFLARRDFLSAQAASVVLQACWRGMCFLSSYSSTATIFLFFLLCCFFFIRRALTLSLRVDMTWILYPRTSFDEKLLALGIFKEI